MSVNSLPKTVTRQCRNSELNLGPTVPESNHANHSATEPPSVGCSDGQIPVVIGI